MLANKVPTAANDKYRARIVVEKSILWQLVETGSNIAAMENKVADLTQVNRELCCNNAAMRGDVAKR